MRRLLALSIGLLVVVALTWANRGRTSQEAPSSPRPVRPNLATLELQGAGSCAAQACHNADALTGVHGREYAVALQRDFSQGQPRALDKHAQAYAVLFEDRSKRIFQTWKGLASPGQAFPEHEALCLKCHVHPGYDRHPVRVSDGVPQFRLEDGVSCEACHGPAERWLASHFRPGFTERHRVESGMTDTRSVLGRVRVCLDCHVGSPGAEVDHDLIAAGHPWLHFEVGEYHARWHRHWERAKDVEPGLPPSPPWGEGPEVRGGGRKDFEVRLWLVGQVASAQAALELLAARASDDKHAWPEFAEHNCFACHHDLQALPSRRTNKTAAPPWNAWYTALIPSISTGDKDTAKLHGELTELRRAMQSWQPSRKHVVGQARAAADRLGAWLANWQAQEPQRLSVDLLADGLLRMPVDDVAQSWLQAAQWQRAFSGLKRARADLGLAPAAWAPGLADLESILRLGPGHEVPRTYDPAVVSQAIGIMQGHLPK